MRGLRVGTVVGWVGAGHAETLTQLYLTYAVAGIGAGIEARNQQLIRMPAFRDRVDGSELADLVAYVQGISGAFEPTDDSPVAGGHELAVKFGCFGCHGPGSWTRRRSSRRW